jgi:hypothetical protein
MHYPGSQNLLRLARIALCQVLACLVLAPTGAALAQAGSTTGGTAISEPSDFMIFAIGLAGLIIGRRVARRKD